MGENPDAPVDSKPGSHKSLCRSASWSPARSNSPESRRNGDGQRSKSRFQRFPPSLNPRPRSSLPPLQVSRPIFEPWSIPGSDDEPDSKPHLSSRFSRFDKECSKVADHIYVGGDAVARDREILRKNAITHILNCVGGSSAEYFKPELVYKTLWLTDSPSEDITSVLYDVFDYFEEVREQGGRVFVHCYQGVSRSISLVIAYVMWRKGQSFDDAFRLVKAARGIANPNVGFACQLLECQKRVNEIPASPNSGARVQRMRPHSAYDPLHLVPKSEREASARALDSRGAFLVHTPSTIFVWIGKLCEPVMAKDAKAAACQVVRYENLHGAIVTVHEGDEPGEFWGAFSEEDAASSTGSSAAGERKVSDYDSDYEIFSRAVRGGESNWSILRRKFISGAVKDWVSGSKSTLSRVYSDSFLNRETDAQGNKVQHLSDDLDSGEWNSPASEKQPLSPSSQVVKPLKSLNISS
ncbi:mitogen-activated protein kinase phosphatase 1 [Wolffia australiana]